MTVRLQTSPDSILIVDQKGKLTPATKSTLRLLGFSRRDNGLAAEHSEDEDLCQPENPSRGCRFGSDGGASDVHSL